jgi:hypothetical protein
MFGAHNTRTYVPQLTVVATLSGLTANLTTYTPPNNQSANIWTPPTPNTCVGPYFATDANNTLIASVATGEEHTFAAPSLSRV